MWARLFVASATCSAVFGQNSTPLPPPLQCVQDEGGNRICIGLKKEDRVCATFSFQVPIELRGNPVPVRCNDALVWKTSADLATVFVKQIGGESDDVPRYVLALPGGNIAVLGNTFSRMFPVTGDGFQETNAGPIPRLLATPLSPGPSTPAFPIGGDLFLSVLSPSGELLYSTYLGSTGNDTWFGARHDVAGQIDGGVNAGEADASVSPGPEVPPRGGPLLFTFDAGKRTFSARYLRVNLPEARPGTAPGFQAEMLAHGAAVSTSEMLHRFGRDGAERFAISIADKKFRVAPAISVDPLSGIWLTGADSDGFGITAKFTEAPVEAFQWRIPIRPSSGPSATRMPVGTSLSPPEFRGGMAVFSGAIYFSEPAFITPNAILSKPCRDVNSFGTSRVVAALTLEGEVEMLSYHPGSEYLNQTSFDISDRPKVVCRTEPWYAETGRGQVMRLRWGSFGPQLPVKLAPSGHGFLPEHAEGVSVFVSGRPVPLVSLGRGEVEFFVPFDAMVGPAIPVEVEERGQRSEPYYTSIVPLAPRNEGRPLNEDGSINSRENPARTGSIVRVFLTGAGAYVPALEAGRVAPALGGYRLQTPFSMKYHFNGVEGPLSPSYAGPAPGTIGITRIDFRVPVLDTEGSVLPVLYLGLDFDGPLDPGSVSIWVR